MTTMSRINLAALILIGPLLLAACMTGAGTGDAPGKHENGTLTSINALTASTQQARRGSPVTISWDVSNTGSREDGKSSCALTFRPENQASYDDLFVPCVGSRTFWPRTPAGSNYMNVQLSALKEPFDEDSPYLLEVLKITMLDELGPPPVSVDIFADGTYETLVDSRSYEPGEEVVFRLSVPESVHNIDAMFVELNQDVRLEILTEQYAEVLLTSDSKRAFRGGAVPLSGYRVAELDSVAPLDLIGNAKVCRGSCVALEASEDVYFVRVRNTTNRALTVRLWAYGDYLNDLNEDLNDDYYDAPELEGTVSAGAIETVRDVDLWYGPYTEEVTFETTSDAIPLELHRVDYEGAVMGGPYRHGDTFEVLSGEYLRVRAQDADEAATSGSSAYFIERVF